MHLNTLCHQEKGFQADRMELVVLKLSVYVSDDVAPSSPCLYFVISSLLWTVLGGNHCPDSVLPPTTYSSQRSGYEGSTS